MSLASDVCQGRLVSVLEGGYNLSTVGKLATTAIAKMSGVQYSVKDKSSVASRTVRLHGASIIREVKRVQKSFWSLD
jgi:acetoin utilization deacetylase AcuC-like enzyme